MVIVPWEFILVLRDTFEYSPRELDLIAHFSMLDIAPHVIPIDLYKLMVHKAFLDDDRTPWADSLRRCWKALHDDSPCIYRLTPEWDDLICNL